MATKSSQPGLMQVFAELEEEVRAITDSLEMVDPENTDHELQAAIEAYRQELADNLKKSARTRDKVAMAVRNVKTRIEEAKALSRIHAENADAYSRKAKQHESRYRWLEEVIAAQIRAGNTGTPEAPEYPKLKGNHHTLRLQRNSSAQVFETGTEPVPMEYKTATVELPGDVWEILALLLPPTVVPRVEYKLNTAEICKAGKPVPGIELRTGYHLRID